MVSEGQAIESMSGETLLSSCQALPVGKDGAGNNQATCLAYIQGYLDAVDQLTLQREDSFERRALETRARGQMIPNGVIGRSPYCFPPGVALKDVAEKLIQEASSTDDRARGADMLTAALKKHFSCP